MASAGSGLYWEPWRDRDPDTAACTRNFVADGSYSVTVPAGRYTVVGRSPLYESNAALCRAAEVATVTSGHATTADVLCQMS
jgi:hypothetical protein